MRTRSVWTDHDGRFMAEALKLARRGCTRVEPNPAVGAVIVRSGQIIGRGWHKRFGADHAEVAAIKDARGRGRRVRGGTLYVTLEPCCHVGKTPACTEAILREGFSRIVVAAADPSRHAGGKGIRLLHSRAVAVEVGLLAESARELNAWFYTYHETGRPWVIGKWAQTLDGKLACANGRSQWITSTPSRKHAHGVRRSVQAIVTGIGTVLADDPELTVRFVRPSSAGQPTRVVLDPHLRIPVSSNLVAGAGAVETVIVTGRRVDSKRRAALEAAGCRIQTQSLSRGKLNLRAVVDDLGRQGSARVLIEAGATLMSAFLAEDLVDELVVFQAPAMAVDDRARQLAGRHPKQVTQFIDRFRYHQVRQVGDDLMLVLRREVGDP